MVADAIAPNHWPRWAERVGGWLLLLGAGLLLAGMFTKPPFLSIGLVAGCLGLLLLRAPVWRHPAVWAGAALSAWLIATVMMAVARDQPEAGRIPGAAYYWLAIPIVATAAADPTWRRWLLYSLLGVAGFCFVVAVLQWTLGIGDGPLRIDPSRKPFQRARGLSDLSLTYGFVSALLIVISLAPREALGLGRRWVWTARFFGAAALVMCGARGALIGCIAGVGTALSARGRRWLFGAAVAVLVLTALGLAVVQAGSERRFRQMLAGENGRLAIWDATAEIIEDHPWTGVGGRNAYRAAYNQAYDEADTDVPNEFGPHGGAPHAHNTLLAFAAEHGLPAAFLHLALLGTVLVVCWRRRCIAPAGWQAACGVVGVGLVAGMFEPYASRHIPGIGFHACLGFCLALASSDPVSTQISAAKEKPAPT